MFSKSAPLQGISVVNFGCEFRLRIQVDFSLKILQHWEIGSREQLLKQPVKIVLLNRIAQFPGKCLTFVDFENNFQFY